MSVESAWPTSGGVENAGASRQEDSTPEEVTGLDGAAIFAYTGLHGEKVEKHVRGVTAPERARERSAG